MEKNELAIKALAMAKQWHINQKRKYTGNPYFDHLCEVAGLVSPFYGNSPEIISICLLHDVLEDTPLTELDLRTEFNEFICDGVLLLTDPTHGNRAERKKKSRDILRSAPDYIQTIKVADLISNTGSIVTHDPDFAKVYLEEKRLLLNVLTKANPILLQMAHEQIKI